MAAFDRCPICRDDFKRCPHSVVDAETRIKQARTDKQSRKVILDVLKEFGLIPKGTK
jgi:hypothetical protein